MSFVRDVVLKHVFILFCSRLCYYQMTINAVGLFLSKKKKKKKAVNTTGFVCNCDCQVEYSYFSIKIYFNSSNYLQIYIHPLTI